MNSRLGAAALALFLSVAAHGDAPYVVTNLPVTSPFSNSLASQYTAVDDALYFFAETQWSYPALYRWSEADGLDLLVNLVPGYEYTSSVPRLMAFGDKLLFGGYANSFGDELWISDGSQVGTTLLKDIYPAGSSTPVPLFASGGKAYFTAFDRTTGRELWVTDGTPGGTSLLIDITGDTQSSNPTGFVEMGGLVYFLALDQLYVTDGTPGGTSVVTGGAGGTSLGVLADRIYFLGSDLANGRELWSTDGTPAGTAIVKDINPGAPSSWGSIATPFIAQGASLLFIAEDATNGRELWKTDGTEAGTVRVEDITPGAGSTQISRLVASPLGAFFVVDDSDLWVTNGTDAGTVPLEEYARVTGLVAGANGAYLVTSAANVLTLHFSDGTPAGTMVVPGAVPAAAHHLTSTGGMVVFTGTDDTNGAEPWITDGTEAGTHMLANVNSVSGTSYLPDWTRAAGDLVYFALDNELYRSDGTGPGTFKVGELPDYYYYYPSRAAPLAGNTLLFFGTSDSDPTGLWKSDGTVAGTSLVKAFNRVEAVFTTSHGYALVLASEEQYGTVSVWRSDGTAAGTFLISSTPSVSHVVEVAGRVYFLTSAQYWPYEGKLWETGGTVATTRAIMSGRFTSLAAAGGSLFLVNNTTAHGAELWRSDGTAEGTVLVKDIRPGQLSSTPEQLTAVGNRLFFTADDGVYGRELWRSDGTAAGTVLVEDIRPGISLPQPYSLTASGGMLYFFTDDGVHGSELWRSDGTADGTIRLTENANAGWSSPLVNVDRTLMFSGQDALGWELWESNGTAAGTFRLADLFPGSASSFPSQFAVTNDRLFFATTDARLWAMNRATSRLSAADVRVIEGNSGTSTLTFTVTRSGSLSGAATVNYATSDLTATAGSDYQAASGMLSFADGEANKQIAITITGDSVIEQNEAFSLDLSSPTGATLTRDSALGLIEDNDRAVALSVAIVPSSSGRIFRISNAGPSGASVTMRVSESPISGGLSCDGKNPSICHVGFVPAGGFVDFTVGHPGYNEGSWEPGKPPGLTVTATVSALEAEADTSDNTTARMVNSGRISLPPYLVAGTTSNALVTTHSMPSTVRLALTGGVVVSPSSIVVNQANPIATFAMTVAPNAWGFSNVTEVTHGSEVLFRIPIVLPSEQPRLDTKIIRSLQWSYDVGETVEIPVKIVGVLHDGTRPGGTVRLLNNAGDVVQSQTLDADSEATFTLLDISAGQHQYKIEYVGDANFNSVRVDASFNVYGLDTWTNLTVNRQPCSGGAELVVTVTNQDDFTPTGSVAISVGFTEIATLPLVPTGNPGEARASMPYSFSPANYSTYVSAIYEPDAGSDFEASSDSEYVYQLTCPAPTLIASAASASSVSLIWSDVGADQYEIVRVGPAPGPLVPIGTTTGTTFVDSTVAPGSSYIYKINAKSSGGAVLSTSAGDLATTIIFTDDPIVFRLTRVKATHIIQLRLAANAVRALAGQPAWTFTAVAAGQPVRTTEFNELRNIISNALVAALGGSPPSWIDTLSPGGPIKTMHIQQMRNVMK